MISSKGISKKLSNPSLDFKGLREEGMNWIRTLSGDEWTDHNIHDPGITTLELLCYALTELGHRTEFLFDAFSGDVAARPDLARKYFLNRHDILHHLPVTRRDLESFTESNHSLVVLAWFVAYPVLSPRGVVEGGYEISLLLRNDPTYGDLNTDAIFIPYPDTNGKLEVIIFDQDNKRFIWKNIERIVACKFQDDQPDNFVCFERHNCQISLVLEVIYENRTQSDFLEIKARICLSQPAKAEKKGFAMESHQDAIIGRLESREFLDAIALALQREKHKADIIGEVRRKLLGVRNICEDFVSFSIVNTQELKLEAEIILTDDAPLASAMLNRIYDRLDTYLLQYVVRSKERESQRKNVLYGSNLIQEMVGMDGVAAARIVSLNLFIDGVPTISMRGSTSFECINLQRFSRYIPVVGREKSEFTFIRSGVVEKAAEALQEREITSGALFSAEHAGTKTGGQGNINPGVDEDFLESLREYHSIRMDFPEVYNLREDLSHANISEPKKVRALQFRSYLLFFERILVDYLDKLYHFNDLLSLRQRSDDNGEPEIDRLRKNFPEIAEWDLIDYEKWNDSFFAAANVVRDLLRQHRVVDHLLARFSSSVPFTVQRSSQADDLKERLMQKITLLDNISLVTRERGLGISLKQQDDIWNSELLSGFQKRIYFLLGVQPHLVKHLRLSTLKSKEVFGFYLVEHILLIPKDEGSIAHKKFNSAADLLYDYILNMSKRYADYPPYSFQVSVVLPAWGDWRNHKARIETIVREELPAHILPTFHWLNKKNMVDFESCYEDWLKLLVAIN